MKIGYLITARLKSSRLKKKIVLPLNGKTVIDCVIDRCKAVKGIDDVVLCTSTNPQDSELFDYALNNKIKFYIGSEEDVLQRLLDAAKYYSLDAFVSITADNPLHSIEVANKMLDWVSTEKLDYIFASGLPIGLAPYFINTKALEVAVKMKVQADTEIWGPFVNRPDFFSIGYMNFEHNLFPEEMRLTCDYKEDYELIKSIYSNFENSDNPSIYDMSNLINTNKVLLNNKGLVQASVPKDDLDRIKSTFDLAIPEGKKMAETINFKLNPSSKVKTIKL